MDCFPRGIGGPHFLGPWVRHPSELCAYVCLFVFSVFPSFMLECNTEIPYLDEQVKLVFKLHFSN